MRAHMHIEVETSITVFYWQMSFELMIESKTIFTTKYLLNFWEGLFVVC